MSPLSVETLGRTAELLLIEDNYGDELLTREAFLKGKIRSNIAIAHDGEEALRILKREGPYAETPRPDLILLDLNLPCLDGHEVLEEIKSNPNLRDIPVVVLSGSDCEIDLKRSFKLDADAYIVKPIALDHLHEIIRSIKSLWFTLVVAPPPDSERTSVD